MSADEDKKNVDALEKEYRAILLDKKKHLDMLVSYGLENILIDGQTATKEDLENCLNTNQTDKITAKYPNRVRASLNMNKDEKVNFHDLLDASIHFSLSSKIIDIIGKTIIDDQNNEILNLTKLVYKNSQVKNLSAENITKTNIFQNLQNRHGDKLQDIYTKSDARTKNMMQNSDNIKNKLKDRIIDLRNNNKNTKLLKDFIETKFMKNGELKTNSEGIKKIYGILQKVEKNEISSTKAWSQIQSIAKTRSSAKGSFMSKSFFGLTAGRQKNIGGLYEFVAQCSSPESLKSHIDENRNTNYLHNSKPKSNTEKSDTKRNSF